ncbi:MAG TPA: GTP 3',8-cyclase MoaA [Caldithrix abyssi]|uniref:GTP 3',8-cyclase n=1 Tax=Caldithrix abyssi TaxID=187145 RepID=A0A7V4U3S3_CALAY|nr:GTP 3',8-cyclase MoaA [Caldithrix abyssi]
MDAPSFAHPIRSISATQKPLIDPFGRKLDYLRLALTDRCNLRCRYCMPEEGIAPVNHSDILSFEEMFRLVRVLAGLGVKKVRLTGGEPFVRKGALQFIRNINALKDIQSVHITTNGVLIGNIISQLKELNLGGVNLSLDTLNPKRFAAITRRNYFPPVYDALQKLLISGIPLKLNMVVQKGVNDDELGDFIELARDHALQVRFIEEMPFNGLGKKATDYLTAESILQTIRFMYPQMRETLAADGTARIFTIPGFKGSIGLIGGYSRQFCDTCSRLRITPLGVLKTCLYDNGVLDLRALLRSGATDRNIEEALRDAVARRYKDGFEAEAANRTEKHSMAMIGG